MGQRARLIAASVSNASARSIRACVHSAIDVTSWSAGVTAAVTMSVTVRVTVMAAGAAGNFDVRTIGAARTVERAPVLQAMLSRERGDAVHHGWAAIARGLPNVAGFAWAVSARHVARSLTDDVRQMPLAMK